MPLRNRVDPFSRIEAVSSRGLFMGNRGGCFHRDDQTLRPTHWAGGGWIICRLEWKGRKRPLMQPRRYTELFFLDEAVALATGHRPCFECRNTDAKLWLEAAGLHSAKAADRDLQAEMKPLLRPNSSTPRETCSPEALPDCAFFAVGETAYLKQNDKAHRFSWQGYGTPEPLPETARRLTPVLACRSLAAGYQPQLHSSLN
ncbi:MAG: hypothetical protein MRY64_03620 [Hyphomonadaceae bacterium]|nr:hypothetical protein [Hyphomonadaceae bacterium]